MTLRWRKQVRVNGSMTQTMRLRHIEGDEKGVILSLVLLTEKNENPRLLVELDGDFVVEKNITEHELYFAAKNVLEKALVLLENEQQLSVVSESRQQRTNFPL